MGFKIGSGSTILMGCYFDSAKGLVVGDNSVITARCRIDTRGGIDIGNNVSIASDVTILTADHDMNNNMQGRTRSVIIDDFAWIGTRCMIMPGVRIYVGGIASANSLVNKDINRLEVVAGIPGKVIKMRQASFNYKSSYMRLFH